MAPPRPPDRGPLALAPPVYGPPGGGSPAVIPAAPPAPPPPPYPGYMSPQDLLAAATKAIADAYAPQIAEMQRQQQTMQQRNAAQQAGLVELYKILAGSMSGLGGDISGIYNQGAQDIGKYTQGVVSSDLPTEQAIVSSGAAQGPGYGSAYPQLAGQQGQVQFLKAVQDANQQEGDVASKIQALIAQEPERVQSLLQQLQSQQADYAKQAQPVVRSVGGNLVAYDPTTGKTQVLYQGAGGSGGPPKTFRGPGGSVYAWAQDAKGNWRPQQIAAGTSADAKPPPTVSGPGGAKYAWQQTKNGGWKLVQILAGKPAAAGKPTYWTDKAGNRHMTSGGVDTIIVPATGRTQAPPSQKSVSGAWKVINASKAPYWASTSDPNTPISLPTVQSQISAYNRQNGTAYTVGGLLKMNARDRAAAEDAIGIAQFQSDPQEVYLNIIRQYGIPARRAWQMVRKVYPGWGKGYFSGKGSAAATGGSGVSYSGVPQQQASLAEKYGTKYGVDPRVLLAIAGHETQWGTTGAGRQGYTLGYGVTDSGTLPRYRGVANQYRWAAQTLAKWGVHTIQDILAGLAAPYATDPNWERAVAEVYQSLDGGTV